MQSSSEQKDDCSQVSADPQGTDALGSKDNELDDIGRQAQQGSVPRYPHTRTPSALRLYLPTDEGLDYDDCGSKL